jgi:hypothetical protein
MLFLVPAPVGTIIVLLVLYGVFQHFWLFVLTVGPAAVIGMLFVRWCWDSQDRRRARKIAGSENTSDYQGRSK